MLEDGVEMLL